MKLYMPDTILMERVELILLHAKKVSSRLQDVHAANYFTASETGEQLYDSLLQRLQAMGRILKNQSAG